ncbi:MAG: SH3 domain-containing protein [Chloroflexi bacterium]|jgi:hypothetical protein|nr:SH3 domain-containing protein [Chloroflexota bacterium]
MIKKLTLFISMILVSLLLIFVNNTVNADYSFQQPTIALPTVTGTPKGATAYVRLDQEETINVRSGPGYFYDQVGVLLAGQEVPVLGRSAGGDWVLIEYPGIPEGSGWVYSALVTLSAGTIPIVEPPSTPTPETTETINPTLAAQFLTTPVSTRLPTYTPAAPQSIPTYMDEVSSGISQRIPVGLIILVIGGLGVLITLISYFTDR